MVTLHGYVVTLHGYLVTLHSFFGFVLHFMVTLDGYTSSWSMKTVVWRVN